MAVTVTTKKRIKLGNAFAVLADIAMDNSYATGGEPVTEQQFGLTTLDLVLPSASSGYDFEFDHINKKMKVFQHLRTYTVVNDLASIAANTTVDVAITVTGIVAATDRIVDFRVPAALINGLVVQRAAITADNTVTLRISNVTAGALDAASGNFDFIIEKDVAQEVPNTTNLSTVTAKVIAIGT